VINLVKPKTSIKPSQKVRIPGPPTYALRIIIEHMPSQAQCHMPFTGTACKKVEPKPPRVKK